MEFHRAQEPWASSFLKICNILQIFKRLSTFSEAQNLPAFGNSKTHACTRRELSIEFIITESFFPFFIIFDFKDSIQLSGDIYVCFLRVPAVNCLVHNLPDPLFEYMNIYAYLHTYNIYILCIHTPSEIEKCVFNLKILQKNCYYSPLKSSTF